MVNIEKPVDIKEIFKFYGIPFSRYKNMDRRYLVSLIQRYYIDTKQRL